MDVRRVVTGHNASNKAVFVSDERVAPTTPALLGGFAVHKLWGADELFRLPDDGSLPSYTSYFPPAGGVRFGFVTFPPLTSARHRTWAGLPSGRPPQPWATTQARKPRRQVVAHRGGPRQPPGGPASRAHPRAPPRRADRGRLRR